MHMHMPMHTHMPVRWLPGVSAIRRPRWAVGLAADGGEGEDVGLPGRVRGPACEHLAIPRLLCRDHPTAAMEPQLDRSAVQHDAALV